jgi:hypothetical protein
LVQAGRNGWVFDPFDPQDIARCLAEAARLKTESRKQKAETGEQFQLSHFSFQHLPAAPSPVSCPPSPVSCPPSSVNCPLPSGTPHSALAAMGEECSVPRLFRELFPFGFRVNREGVVGC